VLSDIEMGAGGPFDDFAHDGWLADLLLDRVEALPDGVGIDLVFNGDTFDFLKTRWEGTWPRHVDARIALGKLERIGAAHPRFFDAVAHILRQGAPGTRDAWFIVGNHDPELVFPEVQAALRERLGEGVHFPSESLRLGDVHIEHGQQADSMFAMDLRHPLVRYGDREILNLPWGSVALLDVAIPMQPLLYHYDRVKPRERVLELMPELKELLVGSFWRYWTRDFLRDLWGGADPLKRMSWVVLKEVVYRFGSLDTDVTVNDQWSAALKSSDDVRLVVLGHEHRPAWWTWGDRKILRAGCLRDEYMISTDGLSSHHLPKVWAEAWMQGDRVLSSALIEAVSPLPPEGNVPDSIFDVLPVVRRLLGSTAERVHGMAAQAEQEALEVATGPARPVDVAEERPRAALVDDEGEE